MIAPYLEQMATQFAGKVDFYKVDVDEQPYLSASQGIRAMPTLKVFRNGIIEETIVWADLDGLMKTIDRLLASEAINTKNNDTAWSVETAEQAKKVTIPNK